MKKIMLLPLAGLVFSLQGVAEEYQVIIDVTRTSTALTFEETNKMKFPLLSIDEGTENGASCVTAYNSSQETNRTSLCVGLTGSGASVKFTGTPNTAIVYTSRIETQEKDGLEFSAQGSQQYINQQGRLNNHGFINVGAHGRVTLTDKSAVKMGDSSYTFTYEISAAYQ